MVFPTTNPTITLPAEPRAQATRPGYIAGLHGAPGLCSAEQEPGGLTLVYIWFRA